MVLAEEYRLECVEDIDLERVVVDGEYRRRVIEFLNALEPPHDHAVTPQGTPGGRSPD